MVEKTRALICVITVLLAACLGASPALADDSTETSMICDRAAFVASRELGVPLDLLRAISLTETATRKNGRSRTWPWTVNMEGDGYWFSSRQEAYDFTKKHRLAGATSFDIGCFQINYRWHKAAFASLDAMFDPLENAKYAAEFLKSLHEELGDWTSAVGAYHSRTPKYARKYIARFQRMRANMDVLDIAASADATVPNLTTRVNHERVNSFPLLQSVAAVIGQASLVPLTEVASTGRFISIDRQ
jgi:hypothetical protein